MMPREFDKLPPSLNAPRGFSNYFAQLGSEDRRPGMVHTGLDPRKEKAGAFARGVRDVLTSSVTAPFDVTNRAIRGGYGSNEEMAEDVFKEIVLPMAGVGTQFAVKGGAGIFGGRLAPGAPRGKLDVAQIMEKRGATPEDIWYNTGWFKGHDKKWKFEIPDTEAMLMPFGPRAGEGGKLAEFLRHPKLYEAYPDLANLSTMRDPNLKSVGAYWSPDPKTGAPAAISFKDTSIGRRGDTLGTLLHETQHGVQDIEGFAKGASSTGKLREGTPAWQIYENQLKLAKAGGRDIGPEEARFIREQSMKEGYQRSAGEVEARNVERRMDMRPGTLEAHPPWWTEYLDPLLGRRVPLVGRQFGGPVGPELSQEEFNRRWYSAIQPGRYVSENIEDRRHLSPDHTLSNPAKIPQKDLDAFYKRVESGVVERREFGGPVGEAAGEAAPPQLPPGFRWKDAAPAKPQLPPGFRWKDEVAPPAQQSLPAPEPPSGPGWLEQGGNYLDQAGNAIREVLTPPSSREPAPLPGGAPSGAMLPSGGVVPPASARAQPPVSLAQPVGPVPGAMLPPGGPVAPAFTRSQPEQAGMMPRPGFTADIPPHPMAPPGGVVPPEPRVLQPPIPRQPQGAPPGFKEPQIVQDRSGRWYITDEAGNLVPLDTLVRGKNGQPVE